MKNYRKAAVLLASAAAAVWLSGCGGGTWSGEGADTTTIGIDREGHVTEVVVEDFSEAYYQIEELKATVEAEVAAYNTGHLIPGGDAPVTLDGITKKGEQVRMKTYYATPQDYAGFTQENLYYGTLRQAAFRGFEMPSKLTDGKGAEYAVSDGDKNHHVVFTDGHDRIVTPYKIIAYTKGVQLISDYEADFSATEGRGAVLLEK
ncbi:MAG: hypothetical protein IKO80_01070 [Lachnospiraceae bacterium]|nr:hypothetical protein [Lachnospiraceae bacterium]